MTAKFREGDTVLIASEDAGEVWVVFEALSYDTYLIQNLAKTRVLQAHADTLKPAP